MFTVTIPVVAHPVEATEYEIVAVPAATPVTSPLNEPTVAIPVAELLHIPPPLTSARVVIPPTQTVAVPVIGAGDGFTVIVLETLHPDNGKQIIVTVPTATPVTIPLKLPTVAIADPELDHVPPVAHVNVIELPAHTVPGPNIGAVTGLTVTGFTAEHPAPIEYVIFTVPAVTPVTIPVPDPTVAIPVALLLQVPPGVRSLSVIVAPIQTWLSPVIGFGEELTFTVTVEKQPVTSVYVITAVPVATP